MKHWLTALQKFYKTSVGSTFAELWLLLFPFHVFKFASQINFYLLFWLFQKFIIFFHYYYLKN